MLALAAYPRDAIGAIAHRLAAIPESSPNAWPPTIATPRDQRRGPGRVFDELTRHERRAFFIYATAHRESSFDKDKQSGSGPNNCDVGYGLMQLTCASHDGIVYPEDLQSPNQSDPQWQADMRIEKFCSETGLCPWINMNNVSALNSSTERFDAAKNLDRYFSGYAAPAWFLEKTRAPQQQGESTYDFRNRVLRRIAWHWRYGHYTADPASCYCGTCNFSYPTDPCNYFTGPDQYRWDNYVSGADYNYRGNVEAEDGPWDGNVCTPPYSSTGCGSSTAPQYSSSATATPACRVADGGSVAIAATYTNTNNVAYESMLDIEVWNDATKINQGYEQRSFGAGSTQNFTWNWTVPTSVTAPAQTYTMKLGVFKSDWSENPHWNNNAGTITVSADNSKYNFECSSTQAWSFNSGGLVAGISSSTTQAYAGQRSLAVSLSGSSSPWGVWTKTSPLPSAGHTVTYRVWIPSSSNISAVQAFVKEGSAGGWRWTGHRKTIAEMTAGAWNSFSVTVPTDAAALDSIGVEFSVSSSWTGTVYVDQVTW